MSFMSEASTKDHSRAQRPHTVWWQELTGYRAVARFCYSWIEIEHSTKGLFSPASSFAVVNLWWSQAGIEIPYPALFPLPISRPNPIKTRNPAPTSNWNPRFPPLFFSSNPEYPHEKKPNPASRQTYWGPSISGRSFTSSYENRSGIIEIGLGYHQRGSVSSSLGSYETDNPR